MTLSDDASSMSKHIARAEHDISAPPETLRDVLTDPGPNPEITSGWIDST
ncbi:hypothetical protein ACLRGF_07205 [Mycetocola zhadangensis]